MRVEDAAGDLMRWADCLTFSWRWWARTAYW